MGNDEKMFQNFKDCSNLDEFKQRFVLPFLPGTNGFPDVVPLGYYKVLVHMNTYNQYMLVPSLCRRKSIILIRF